MKPFKLHRTTYKKMSATLYQNKDSRLFYGEIVVKGIIEYQSVGFASLANAVRYLNKQVEKYNVLYNAKLPLILFDESKDNKPEPKPEIAQNTIEADRTLANTTTQQESNNMETKATPNTAKAPLKTEPPKPHRKPFTPYGLNGYLVDKNGNIRLHLDRKASARTIVLTSDMFAMLSDMVKATQEQTK